jgi:unsaturated rhamnogalacturonyl hydrolase
MRNRAGVIIAAVTALYLSAFAQPEFSPDSIKNVCKRVAQARLKTTMADGWQQGTYYAGIMALYDLTKDTSYLDSAITWGTYHQWLSGNTDTLGTNANDAACYQTYLEVYFQDPKPARIAAAVRYVDYNASVVSPTYSIIDYYFMAAPNFTRVYTINKNSAILDSLLVISTGVAQRHFNSKDSLYSSNSSDTTRDHNYWGRGCGWGVGSLCRILQYLPPGHPSRAFYVDKLRRVLCRLIHLQDKTDWMWRSDITHPTVTPNKESSCTSLFCFALFYAINNGIVDTTTYLGPAKKAWKALLDCIGVDPQNPDLIGWSQGVGGSPSNNFGPTNHDPYTEGAFFMAGNEFNKFLNPSTKVRATGRPVPAARLPGTGMAVLWSAANGYRIALPENARGLKVYTLDGRMVFDLKTLVPGATVLQIPRSLLFGGKIAVVRFLY